MLPRKFPVIIFIFSLVSLFLVSPKLAFAHENYVLPKNVIQAGMGDNSINVFDALKNPQNLIIGAEVSVGVTVLIIAYFFFQISKIGIWLNQKIQKAEPLGHVILRIALAASLITSAALSVFLGPEIPTSALPAGTIIHYSLFVLGFLLLVGFMTEITAFLSLLVLASATFVYKDYMLTYFNYFGELVALLIYGSRYLSVDLFIKKPQKFLKKIKEFEIPIIRITYGISVLYPAISIKLLHPIIIEEIDQKYHLSSIHWLFPKDPLLISLGTGLAQIAVGICLIIGFETRLNAFVTLLLYIGSILFFKEAVWPHYILLALAFYLVINNGGGFTLDGWIEKHKPKFLRFI